MLTQLQQLMMLLPMPQIKAVNTTCHTPPTPSYTPHAARRPPHAASRPPPAAHCTPHPAHCTLHNHQPLPTNLQPPTFNPQVLHDSQLSVSAAIGSIYHYPQAHYQHCTTLISISTSSSLCLISCMYQIGVVDSTTNIHQLNFPYYFNLFSNSAWNSFDLCQYLVLHTVVFLC